MELGQAALGPQHGSSTPLHAGDAAAAASPHLDPALLPGEQLAETVTAEVHRQRFEALFENSDRLVHANGTSRDLSSPADDEVLPLLADVATHPIPAQPQHAAAAGSAGAARAQQASSHSSHAAGPAAAEAAGEAAPAMIGGGIPRSIFVLSMVSMALTSASCVFNTLLPIYMVTELKMTMRTMGMFEGRCTRAVLVA